MGKKKIDEVTGVETTGHEWDGIEELNKPLPKWWLWVFYATIVWAVGYWVLMPAWPLIDSHTTGILGYSQRERVARQLADARDAKANIRRTIAESDLQTIVDDPELFRFALASGESAFGDNCAPCHGRGAQGSFGYPNLRDDAWLWGGTLDDIHHTILYGIRADHPETRSNNMPGFGKEGWLTPDQIGDVAEFVLSLSSRSEDAEAAERGQTIYADNCAGCHDERGEGNTQLGAPDLSDELWLYGGDKAGIVVSVRDGRAGMMPAWHNRLDEETLKELAIYVHSLGGGQ
jgi:cytochrome c oxidase cbb3-type subunit III